MPAAPLRTPVDPFTEVMFCKDSEVYPFTDLTQIQLAGPMDEAAMAGAWEAALARVPLFSSAADPSSCPCG